MMLIKLTHPMLFRGAVLWPGTQLDLPDGVAAEMVRDRHAVPLPRPPEIPKVTIGECRGS